MNLLLDEETLPIAREAFANYIQKVTEAKENITLKNAEAADFYEAQERRQNLALKLYQKLKA